MKIATIYNNEIDCTISVMWDADSKKITYQLEDGTIEDADETAETLQEAIDDTYARYYSGWDLEFEEI